MKQFLKKKSRKNFLQNFNMEYVAVELLQEIGLYLDPKSYHSLRKSMNTRLPIYQITN